MAFKSLIDVYVRQSTTPVPDQKNDQEPNVEPEKNTNDENLVPESNNTAEEVAIVPNTGHVSSGNELAIGGGLSLVILSILVSAFILIKKYKQKKYNSSLIKSVYNKQTTKFPIFLILPFLGVLGLLVALNPFFSFAAVNELELPVRASRYVDLDVTEGTSDKIYWIKDTIKVPASSTSFEVYLTAESQYLTADEDSSATIASKESQGLAQDTFGYTLSEPDSKTEYKSLPNKSSAELLYTSEATDGVLEIPIYFAVRATTLKIGHYKVAVNYTVKTNRDLIMQDMTPEICSYLTQGIRYTFTDIRDNKEYSVEKLADGNCWMAEDLALELVAPTEEGDFVSETGGTIRVNEETGAPEIVPLDSTNTAVTTKFVPTHNTETTISPGAWESCYSEESCMQKGYRSFKYTDNAINQSSEDDESSINVDRYLYSWITATAGTGNVSTNIGSNASSSICPKGWHLPSSEEQSVLLDSGSYLTLRDIFTTEKSIYYGSIANDRGIFWGATVEDDHDGGEISAIINDVHDNRIYKSTMEGVTKSGASIRCVADIKAVYVTYEDNSDARVTHLPTPEIITESEDNVFTVRLSSEIPTRENYVFMGWATTQSGSPKYQPGDEFIATSAELKLYAVWSRSTELTFQNFDEAMCHNLAPNETYAITDSRDNKTYSISRMNDGNCWMTQNLDLDLDPETPLTSEDTDLPEGTEWHARAKTYTKADEEAFIESYNNNEHSGYSVPMDSDHDDDMLFTGVIWDYTLSGNISLEPDMEDYCFIDEENHCSDRSYSYDIDNHGDGNLYNLFAASAGSVGLKMTDYDFKLYNTSDALASICPKGWFMAKTDNYTELARSYGLNQARYDTQDMGNDYYLNRIPNFTNSFVGFYDQGMVYDAIGYLGPSEFNKISVYQSFPSITIVGLDAESEGFMFSSLDQLNPDMYAEVFSLLGGSVRCVKNFSSATLTYEDNVEEDIAVPGADTKEADASHTVTFTISDFIPEREGYIFTGWSKTGDREGELYFPGDNLALSSPSLTLYATWLKEIVNVNNEPVVYMQDFANADLCENLETEVLYGLKDNRDDKIYAISKLKDGNCWMSENLKLELVAPSEENPSGGARRINSEKQEEVIPLTSENTNILDSFSPTYTTETYPTNNSWSGNTNESRSIKIKGEYYYNWYSATATSSDPGDIEVNTSICPAGWSMLSLINYDQLLSNYERAALNDPPISFYGPTMFYGEYGGEYKKSNSGIIQMWLPRKGEYLYISKNENESNGGKSISGGAYNASTNAYGMRCINKKNTEDVVPKALITKNENNYTLTLFSDNNTYKIGDNFEGLEITKLGYFYENFEVIPWNEFKSEITDIDIRPSFSVYTPTSTKSWFSGLENLNSISGLEYLDTSKTTDMSSMFRYFKLDLTLPEGFGREATNMSGMFYNVYSTSLILPGSFGGKATDMSGMFEYMQNLTTLNLPESFGRNAVDMSYMFYNSTGLTTITFPDGFGKIATDADRMFYEARNIESLDFPSGFGQNVTEMAEMFGRANSLKSINLPAGFGSKATSMQSMFSDARSLASINLPAGFGSKATSMQSMFSDARSLASVELPAGFGQNAINMNQMFYQTYSLASLTIPEGCGGKATDMMYMFRDASSLTSLALPTGFGQKATTMYGMFLGTKSLPSLTLPEGFGSQATNMAHMFSETALTSLTLPSGFGQNATNLSDMFWRSYSLASINLPIGFGQNATYMSEMFNDASALTSLTLPAGFGQNAKEMYGMFFGASALSHIYVSTGTDFSFVPGGKEGNAMFLGNHQLPNFSNNNANNTSNAHIGTINGIPGYFTDVCVLTSTCPEGNDPNESSSSASSTPSTSTPASLNDDASISYISPLAAHSYGYYEENSYISGSEEIDESEHTEDPAEHITDTELENDKTAPLGVIKKTEKEKGPDSISILVISISILLVILGITAIVVIEKRNND